jgi:hypothetical protein
MTADVPDDYGHICADPELDEFLRSALRLADEERAASHDR